MDLCNIQDLKSLLGRHGFRFSRSMGQNFLTAGWVPRAIAEACGADRNCGVLEIGPGAGCLTRELCQRAGRVLSVELDRDLLPVLGETMTGAENFSILNGDVLQLDLPALADQQFPGLTPLACANLPYNITTPALRALVDACRFRTITVLVQREVALRLTAKPGTADYGGFSVYMQYYTEPEILFDVPRDCFFPVPKVDSAAIRFVTRSEPPVAPACGEEFLFRTVRAAFALRRKTLRNSLDAVFGKELGRDAIAGCIEACGLTPTVRGEELDLPGFAALADALWAALGEKNRP